MRPTILRVNGERKEVMPKNGTDFTLEEAQGIVGGLIDIVYLSDTQIMVVNDEGMVNGMKVNRDASLVYMITRGCVQPIYGDVLVCDTEMIK